MEPIELLKKEKKHLARLKTLRTRIYTPLCDLDAQVFPSPEPIPENQRESLAYQPVAKGDTWAGLFGCAWFHLTGTVPPGAAGKHVAAHINIGGEGLLYGASPAKNAVTSDAGYIDRVHAGVGKSVFELYASAQGGERVEFYIDAGYNGYYNRFVGAGVFRFARLCVVDDALLAYYYDYLTVASLLSATTDGARRAELEALLDQSYAARRSVDEARAVLAPLFAGMPDPTVSFTAVGHSHLDLAWLWPLRETKRKAARTFSAQLANMARWPEYTYGASQPQQFEFLRQRHPELFGQLQQQAKAGQFEPQGAMWVEADTNLASGEALVRQLLYGIRYFEREFGQRMRICWLPDVFGYNGNLPQLLKKSGVPYFMTIKLSWNEHNHFPHRSFVWSGIDGSEVLVHMPPDETYNSAGSPACAAHARDSYPEKEVAPEALLLYGLGDGGGGPGEAHIEMVRRQASLQGSPQVRFGTADVFFDALEKRRAALPRYAGELYLEKHQGTYTTQGANKRYNRLCEYALCDAETLAAFAAATGQGEYQTETYDRLWKEVLLYQFHDILPGSSINRVYQESRARYAEILSEAQGEVRASLAAISGGGEQGVYNPTSYPRPEYVKTSEGWRLAQAKPYGFCVPQAATWQTPTYGPDLLENELVCLRFAPDGSIRSLVLKATGFEYSAGSLNRLTLYHDKFLYYNAWDIDWEYTKKPKTVLRARRVELFADGPHVVRRTEYAHGATRIVQDVVLTAGSPVVRFETRCNYQEKLRMLRADFETAIQTEEVLCDIQYGSIRRTTRDETLPQRAQFEVCAHKYVDLSDEAQGLSLLNNCKYGHRAKGGLLSLNLLRAPLYPDPEADRGEHSFTYALYPHAGVCGVDTLREAYFLNKPLLPAGATGCESIASVSNQQVVLETIKLTENGRAAVVRLYESTGQAACCALTTGFAWQSAEEADLMEQPLGPIDPAALTFAPYEIKTLLLHF